LARRLKNFVFGWVQFNKFFEINKQTAFDLFNQTQCNMNL
jgi:hypothetical protein